jgi:hypothetical protein
MTQPARTIHDLANPESVETLEELLESAGEDLQYYEMTSDPATNGNYAEHADVVFKGVDVVVVSDNKCGHVPTLNVDTARMDVHGSVTAFDVIRLAWAASVLSFDATFKVDPLWWETPEDTLIAAKAAIADLKAVPTPNDMAYGSCDKVIEGIELRYDAQTRTLTIEPGLEG